MELVHLHVFQGDTPAVGNCHAVTHASKSVAGDPPGAAIAAGGEENGFSMECMNHACANLKRDNAAWPPFGQDEIQHQGLTEDPQLLFEGVLVHRLNHHVPGGIASIPTAGHQSLAVVARVAAA